MTSRKLLEYFDECGRNCIIPMLDNGYVFPADVRMSVYRSEDAWLMIIEELCINNRRTCGVDSFNNVLSLLGTDHPHATNSSQSSILYPIDECPDAPLFESEFDWEAQENASCVMIRGECIALDLSINTLLKKGIELFDPPKKDPVSIMRSLIPEHRSLLLASEAELQQRNPRKLPLFIQLNEWLHPNLVEDEWPSKTETFRMLADAIAAGDRAKYRPKKMPNTHWRNWPEAGLL